MQFKEGYVPAIDKTNKFGRLRLIARALQKGQMMNESKELEREAIALVKQYGFFLGPAKPFLRRLAEFLNWQDLKGML